jgi:transcription antitermination factor NusG
MTQFHTPISDFEMKEWYAVYTRHQHEKAVAENFSGRGLEVFLPLYETLRQWNDRQKRLSLPLFPCYVFYRGNVERRARVLSTPGVHSIVGFGGQPAAIQETEIEAIRIAVTSGLRAEPFPFLQCGDRVRVKAGPLEGIEGILVRKKNSSRLILSAELLQKSMAVEVDAFSVEPVRSRIPARPLGSSLPAQASHDDFRDRPALLKTAIG